MKQNYLAVKAFVYFGYNYDDPKEFIHYICEKTGKKWLENHLSSKFSYIYKTYGSHAVMNYFFTELNEDLREALVEYAVKVYFPSAFRLTDEEKAILGI